MSNKTLSKIQIEHILILTSVSYFIEDTLQTFFFLGSSPLHLNNTDDMIFILLLLIWFTATIN